MKLKNLVVGIVLGIALAAGVFVSVRMTADNAELAVATVLPHAVELPSFSLLTQTGEVVDQSVFLGDWNLVFFGFTHCPDVCPLTLQMLARAKTQLADEGIETSPRIVFVSVDPERDTPELMGAYLQNFGSGNLGLTGELEQIQTLTSALGIYFNKIDTGSEYYTVDHSAVVIVIGPDGLYRALFTSPYKAEDLAHDLPLLMER